MRRIRFAIGLARRALPYIPGQPAMHEVPRSLAQHVPGKRSSETGERR